MARMYPSAISPNTESAAERLLFREFQNQLPANWIVMHGVGWLSRRKYFDEIGEVDFVIVDPRHGVLLLEVKGGQIHGEWSNETWTSTNRHGTPNVIKNPVKQVERSLWQLRDKLRDNPPTRDFAYEMYRGVAFPETLLGANTVGVDWDRNFVLDSSDLANVTDAIQRMFSPQPLKEPLTKPAIDALVRLLQPTLQLERRGLAAEMLEGEERLLTLTAQQYQVLNMLQFQRQAVINGCAGSGKTLLAMEKAIRLSEQGFQVLLTCFNKNLSAWMRSVIAQSPDDIAERIRVNHYHDLAVQLCEEAGMPSIVRPDDQSYWDDGLSNDLLAAIPQLEVRFDAIVVDEGQDFSSSWWITLQELLQDPVEGVFYIFQDEQQALYRRDSDLPITSMPYSLETNCRSTASIHRTIVDFYEGDPKPVSYGPDGRPIEQVSPGTHSGNDALRRVISKLVNDEGIATDRIVVLTPNSRTRSEFREGDKLGNLAITWNPQPAVGTVRLSSIHAWKGLESDIVVIVETDRLAQPNGHRLAYVALSRARHHVIVVGSLPAPHPVQID